jgi:hypothetical protein
MQEFRPFISSLLAVRKEPQPGENYDAFVPISPGLFNTRDRAEHTRNVKPFLTRSVRS